MRHLAVVAATAALALAAGAAHAAQQTMYQTDFTTSSTYAGVTEVTSGAGAIANVGAGPFGAVTGNILFNDTNAPQATLWTLTNLPTHTSLTVDFDAIFIDSWDSTNGSPAPDYYEVYLDGNLWAQMTSNNASGSVAFYNGGVSTFFGHFFNNGSWGENVVDMSTGTGLTFAHSNSSFVLSIQAGGAGWQGGSDESWGIDNLSISANLAETGPGGIPEPTSWALMIMGFGGIGAAMRNRRRVFAAA